jgi:nanoRNase/pAp phosphatase (c-di-AMP/oligoRNAs hydrolase)
MKVQANRRAAEKSTNHRNGFMVRSPGGLASRGLVSHLSVEKKLARLLALTRGRKRALVLTHDNPDPDSLASAVALSYLLETHASVQARIVYGGIVGRAENTAMIRVLRLPVVPVSRVVFEDSDLLALVDTQPSVGNHSLPARYKPDIVIDHHPQREEPLAPFADVGGDYGATSTILVEYLRHAGLTLPREVATALFYGIKADTRDLERETTQVDVESYLFLLPRIDKEALAQIEHPALPARYFQLYNLAIERARVRETAVTVDLGAIYTPDMVAEIAERMQFLEGMKWSLAYGSFKGNLYLSLRTRDRRMNAGRIIRGICEDLGGSSGGHGSMAGARLPLTGSRQAREVFKRSIVRRFLSEFGVSDSRGRPLLSLPRTREA